MRPSEISGDASPDIDSIAFTMKRLDEERRQYDCFGILRPTSPFRKPETIRRAWECFTSAEINSLRAVEKVTQHPGKMWVVREDRLLPLLSQPSDGTPWHSQQYAALPVVYIQNASLEIAWSRVVRDTRTIAGTTLIPFFTEGNEGIDINSSRDWWYAQYLLERGQASLPVVDRDPYPADCLPAGTH